MAKPSGMSEQLLRVVLLPEGKVLGCAGQRKSLQVQANGIASYFPPVSSAAKRGFAAPRKSGRGDGENGATAAAAVPGSVRGDLC